MSSVVHHVICQHQIEVEVWPAMAEVFFQDERYVNPVNTQVQFDAIVYNAPTDRVTWEVKNLNDGPGVGTIDASGLYKSPPKGSLPHGLTDVIVATAIDDPSRKAYARVALIGIGPEPEPLPKLEIFPKRVYLYYRSGPHNEYIDASNTKQLFWALLCNTASNLEWQASDNASSWHEGPWFLYEPSAISGSPKTVKIAARLKDDINIKDEATVILINYAWPDIIV